MTPPVPERRIAPPDRVPLQKSAGGLPRDVPIGKHNAGNCHHIGVFFEEANRVFEVGWVNLHIVIEKRDVSHIDRHLANGGVALSASSGWSDEYGYSYRRVTRW